MRWGLAASIVGFSGILGAAVMLDPYDTGRFTGLPTFGTSARNPRLANASRGRDTGFDAAIIGNSHIQLLSPENLSGKTGLRFVSLMVPDTVVREQLVMLDYVLRVRTSPLKALIVSIDEHWCTGDSQLPPTARPFPYWLYDASSWVYVRGLLRLATVQQLHGRISLLLGRGRRARPDGYWDYRPDYLAVGYALEPAQRKLTDEYLLLAGDRPVGFPAADALKLKLSRLSPDTKVVLLRPPVFFTALPADGTPAADILEGCRSAFAAVAQIRRRTIVLDWLTDRPEVRLPDNFFDHTHYRAPVARAIEAELARALVD